MKQRVIYLVLTLFLGLTGIHDCYLNKNKTGVVTFLLFVVGAICVPFELLPITCIITVILGIKTLFNMIDIMSMSDKTFNLMYNN